MNKKQDEQFNQVIHYLTELSRYDDSLPGVAALLTLSAAARRQICRAVEVMEAHDPEAVTDEALSEIMCNLDALPAAWPANSGAFAHHLHQIVRGQRPSRTTIHPDGAVTVEEYASKLVVIH